MNSEDKLNNTGIKLEAAEGIQEELQQVISLLSLKLEFLTAFMSSSLVWVVSSSRFQQLCHTISRKNKLQHSRDMSVGRAVPGDWLFLEWQKTGMFTDWLSQTLISTYLHDIAWRKNVHSIGCLNKANIYLLPYVLHFCFLSTPAHILHSVYFWALNPMRWLWKCVTTPLLQPLCGIRNKEPQEGMKKTWRRHGRCLIRSENTCIRAPTIINYYQR